MIIKSDVVTEEITRIIADVEVDESLSQTLNRFIPGTGTPAAVNPQKEPN